MSAMFVSVIVSLLGYAASFSNALQSPTLGKLDVYHNPDYRAHRPSEYMRTLKKYGITPTHPQAYPVHELVSPEGHVISSEINLGLVPASPVQNQGLYQSPITIGEGAQAKTFILQFDSGSPDLWVFSSFLPTELHGNHTLYNPTQSDTSVPLGMTFNISFLDGSGASGLVFSDTVSLGGITLKNQAVEAANLTDQSFFSCACDGILGLDLELIPSSRELFTTVQNLIQSSEFKQPVFTALLTRVSEPEGFFTFGYINETFGALGVGSQKLSTLLPGLRILGVRVGLRHARWESYSQTREYSHCGYGNNRNSARGQTGGGNICIIKWSLQ